MLRLAIRKPFPPQTHLRLPNAGPLISFPFSSKPKKQNTKPEFRREVAPKPKKGTREHIAMHRNRFADKRTEAELTPEQQPLPKNISCLLFGLSLPQSFLLYKIIWADPCSDALFMSYELLMSWIAALSALEGSAAVALGFIDYRLVYNNKPDLVLAMRKKRLAFGKFAFVMAIAALCLVDKPSPSSVAPMLVGQVYSAVKMGTQITYNLTPEKFFYARTLLSMYNVALLALVWQKLRKGRKEKVELEYNFFLRVDNVMARMAYLFEDAEYRVVSRQK